MPFNKRFINNGIEYLEEREERGKKERRVEWREGRVEWREGRVEWIENEG